MRRRTDPLHASVYDRCLQYRSSLPEEIAMKRYWIENGWRRFLDWLKELWGKRTDPDLATV